MRYKPFAVLILLSIWLAGCALGGLRETVSEVSFGESGDMAMEAPVDTIATGGVGLDRDLAGSGQISSQIEDATLQQVVQQPLIIRNGRLELVVADVDESVVEISDIVQDLEGWVLSTNVRQYSAYRRADMSVRVPVAVFEQAMQVLKELALDVQSESTSGQDVTEEFVDASARLGNLEATADRVRSFLQQADDVEEALAVNRELSRLEAEIESLKGRLNYLQQSAAFSTIELELIPDEASQPIEIGGWRPVGVAKDALETLVSALQSVANVALYLIILVLPLLLVILLPLYGVGRLAIRAIRRRRSRVVPPASDS